jgi:spermidine/putrescine transport system substrate-binding protein
MKNLCLLLALGLLLIPAWASQAQDEAPQVAWVCPEGLQGQTLRIFNWADYVAEQTIPRFEELCGVTVEYFTYASNEEMVNVIRSNAAQYDIIVPTGYTVDLMKGEDLLLPLDQSQIPNLANILPTFTETGYDPGNQFSVPYQWGSVGVAYNTEFVDEPLTSWEDFFSYEGRVVWLDDQRAMLGIALLLNGFDPNTTSEEEISTATDFLLAQNRDGDDSQVMEITFINARNLMLQGEVDMAIGYSGDMLRLNVDCECEDYVYYLPEEGTNIWTDNLAIPFNAPSPALAHAFIDYILDPAVNAELTDWVAYASPNAAAIPLTNEAARTNPVVYPSEEVLAKGFDILYTGEAEQLYSEAWNRVQAEIAN